MKQNLKLKYSKTKKNKNLTIINKSFLRLLTNLFLLIKKRFTKVVTKISAGYFLAKVV